MEQIYLDSIVKLLVTCPHFRGLDMLVDVVDGYEIYSAPYIIGILPRDWDRIKKETNLFTETCRISHINWEKTTTSTTTSISIMAKRLLVVIVLGLLIVLTRLLLI